MIGFNQKSLEIFHDKESLVTFSLSNLLYFLLLPQRQRQQTKRITTKKTTVITAAIRPGPYFFCENLKQYNLLDEAKHKIRYEI